MTGKMYKCKHCGKILDYIPIRLYKYVYGASRYKQFYPVEHYDLCRKCYKIFEIWITNKGGKKNESE